MSKVELTPEEKKALFASQLGMSWDEIEDLPDMLTLPSGDYIIDFDKAEIGESDNNAFIALTGTVTEIIEMRPLDGYLDTHLVVPGCRAHFRFYGEYGVKAFKKAFRGVAEQWQPSGVEDMLQQLQSSTLVTQVRCTRHKEDETRFNHEIREAQIG